MCDCMHGCAYVRECVIYYVFNSSLYRRTYLEMVRGPAQQHLGLRLLR